MVRSTEATSKPVEFVGTSREDLSGFPDEAKLRIGHHLHVISEGMPLGDVENVKPFPSVGTGAYQISVRTGQQGVDHRVFFVAKFQDVIYVLHAFEKKQQSTPQADIDKGKARYEEVRARHRLGIAPLKKASRKK